MQYCELILPADASREDWVRARMKGIGGSDAGSILGLNHWKSSVTLWAEKTKRIQPDDISGSMAVEAGTRLEPVVAQWFADETGKKVQRRGTLRSISHPFMLANVDRWIPKEKVGLEIKTTNAFSAKEWDGDEIPSSYYAQCLHYMAVTGAPYWYIAVLIGGQDFRWKTIPRNEEDIKLLMDEEAEFWKHVQDGTMPDHIDGSDSTTHTLSRLYSGSDEKILDITEAASDILDKYDELTEQKKKIDASIQECKNGIMALMGESETGTISGRKVTWKKGNPRETVSLSEIKKKSPDTYAALKEKGFVKVSAASRIFRIW